MLQNTAGLERLEMRRRLSNNTGNNGRVFRAQIFWKSNKIAVLLSALYLSAGLRRGADHNYARKQPQKASLPID